MSPIPSRENSNKNSIAESSANQHAEDRKRRDSHIEGRAALSILNTVPPVPISLHDNTESGSYLGREEDLVAEEGKVWCKNCTIGDPSIISGYNGGKYTLWTIELFTTRGTIIKIRRRYNDFGRLRTKLADKYGGITYILEIPPGTYFYQDRFSPRFLEERRRALEYWLNSIVLNPALASTPEVKYFVLRKKY
ncbi:DEKNAAC102709 [Brettanomyces naardenensis]|uniref:Endosomal/vacuolar adapter protein YPT35 n=1 Tax=Brettanomyces naardenensis TaxID=13370 RepID=A0A448YK51_BRENA|nr:DEKNAAC102709 [Brettanomyces naardenensis]